MTFWDRWVQFGLRRLPQKDGYVWLYTNVLWNTLEENRVETDKSETPPYEELIREGWAE